MVKFIMNQAHPSIYLTPVMEKILSKISNPSSKTIEKTLSSSQEAFEEWKKAFQ